MNKQIQNSAILQHHGILGQRWGVRRSEKQLNNNRMAFTQSEGYRKMLRTVMGNKTINKAANDLTNKNMAKVQRKEAIKKEKDSDVRLGMKLTKGSADDVRKGIEAANKAIQKKNSESQLARGGKSTASSKKVSAKETEKSKIKSMSDAELRQKINRIQMEKQYSQLSKKDISAGQKFISDIFMNAAKQTATNYASKYMTKGVDALIENVLKKVRG